MSKLKLRRPSPALFISLIALFVALGSGAYAASKINTGDIKNGAVTTKKLGDKSVKASRIAKGSVRQNKIPDLSIGNSKLASPPIVAYIDGDATPPVIVNTNTDSTTGAGATGVVRDSEGRYTVTWAPQDPSLDGIDGCITLATAANVGDKRWAQTAIKGSGPTFDTEVQTRDEVGDPKNSKFSAALYC